MAVYIRLLMAWRQRLLDVRGVLSMAMLIASPATVAVVFLMGWTGGYVMLALLIAPYLRVRKVYCP